MKTIIAALAFAGLVTVAAPASAQDNAIGGAIIGAAAGAALGAQMEPRRGGYYYYREGCWRRWRDGSYHRVHHRYCY